jgi:plasmid maintenance system antidote protein VapI
MEKGFWMRLQLHYQMQRVKLELGKRIDTEVHPAA